MDRARIDAIARKPDEESARQDSPHFFAPVAREGENAARIDVLRLQCHLCDCGLVRRVAGQIEAVDFLAQEQQLASGVPAPLEAPHLDPWVGTRVEPANAAAEAVVRAWLAKGDLQAARERVIDGSWYAPLQSPLLDVDSVAVSDLFSAGARVAFQVTESGRYRGGLAGTSDTAIGKSASLRCVGFARVEAGAVTGVRVITDRIGMRRELGK